MTELKTLKERINNKEITEITDEDLFNAKVEMSEMHYNNIEEIFNNRLNNFEMHYNLIRENNLK